MKGKPPMTTYFITGKENDSQTPFNIPINRKDSSTQPYIISPEQVTIVNELELSESLNTEECNKLVVGVDHSVSSQKRGSMREYNGSFFIEQGLYEQQNQVHYSSKNGSKTSLQLSRQSITEEGEEYYNDVDGDDYHDDVVIEHSNEMECKSVEEKGLETHEAAIVGDEVGEIKISHSEQDTEQDLTDSKIAESIENHSEICELEDDDEIHKQSLIDAKAIESNTDDSDISKGGTEYIHEQHQAGNYIIVVSSLGSIGANCEIDKSEQCTCDGDESNGTIRAQDKICNNRKREHNGIELTEDKARQGDDCEQAISVISETCVDKLTNYVITEGDENKVISCTIEDNKGFETDISEKSAITLPISNGCVIGINR